MYTLLKSAIDQKKDTAYSFFLSGDLSQMAAQRDFLGRHGIPTHQNDVYPCLKPKDVYRALKLIWQHRVDGWHHYEAYYVQHKICTEKEFCHKLNPAKFPLD